MQLLINESKVHHVALPHGANGCYFERSRNPNERHIISSLSLMKYSTFEIFFYGLLSARNYLITSFICLYFSARGRILFTCHELRTPAPCLDIRHKN